MLENSIADNGYANGHGMEGELKDLSRKIDVLNETISTFTCTNVNKGTTYSDKIKKNLLVIKSQEPTIKINEKKKEIAEVLKNIPIVDTRFFQTGNLVVNFPDEECRDSAATLIQDNVGGAVTKKIKKLQPKIMICNVHGEEEDVMDAVIEKNVFLQSIADVSQKITHVFKKPAANQTTHYVIKCDLEVRRAIHDHGDKILLRWGRYQIRDRYHVFTCFHCQRHGHTSKNCNFKEDDDVCGNHKTSDCSSNMQKYINRVRQKRGKVNHRINARCCKAFTAKLTKLASITDHGF